MKKIVTAITTTTIAFTGASAMTASADVHEVVKRDTLWDISQKHGTTVDQLMEWNHLTSSLIHPGQKISYKKDSIDKPTATVKSKDKKVQKQSNSDTHTVVAGDTLSEIAYEYGVTHEEIMEWNDLSTTLIMPDQKLKIKNVEKQDDKTASDSKAKDNSASKEESSKSDEKVDSNEGSDSQKETVKEEKEETNTDSETKPKEDKSSSDKKEKTSSGDTYTVGSGDTLSEIAFAHNLSFDKLMEWNNLSSTLIVPGQTLSINGANEQASNEQSSEQENTDVKEEETKEEKTDSSKQEKPKEEKTESNKEETVEEESSETKTEEKPKEDEKAEQVEAEEEQSNDADASTGETMTVTATAYTAECEGCTGVTATGIDLNNDRNKKVIAVDPTVIPLGSTVKVEGYGTAIAGDVGGAIKGNIIDVHLPTTEEALNWGRRTVDIEIVD